MNDKRRSKGLSFKLKVWRQHNAQARGKMTTHQITRIRPDMSFLEMLDILNEELVRNGEDPIAIDSDCREGICGTCGLFINGVAHGPGKATATCQIYMRSFRNGSTIHIEPWRAAAFPVVKDLVVDRSAFDRIVQAGGYISINTGSAPDGNAMPIPQDVAEVAMDAAACIGCGACVASCKNASAMLFVAAKVKHLGTLPQGQPECPRRVSSMLEVMQEEGFGNCTNEYECEAVCPKEISVGHIAYLNREFIKSKLKRR